MQRNYNNNQEWKLLGDSGYPLEPWLLTSDLHAPINSPSWRYTRAHARTRSAVERGIEVLKTRFRSIMDERVLQYNPVFVGSLINACCALHNICKIGEMTDFPIEENLRLTIFIPFSSRAVRLIPE